MKYRFSVTGLIGAMVMAAMIGTGVLWLTEMGTVALVAAMLALFVPLAKPLFPAAWYRDMTGSLYMAVSVEVWQNHIEGNLFKDNGFMLAATDASQYVLEGKIVHIPQAGALPGVQVNRSSLPASVNQRTDTDVTYTLEPYTSDPILLANAETYELSYNKRESILGEHEAALRERIANQILKIWAPTAAGSIIRTTGDAVDAHIDGTTGVRRKLTIADFKKAQLYLNRQNVAMSGRYCILSADMLNDLTDEMTATQNRDFLSAMDAKAGTVGRFFGFDIFVRSTIVTYNSAASAVNDIGQVPAATDNDAALFWQKSAVEYAKGSIKFFERVGDPTYYGDVYSLEVRMGGRRRRDDSKGIVAIVQDAVSGV